jgi:hypothetical protein
MYVHHCGIAFTQSPLLCNPQTIFERARYNKESVPSILLPMQWPVLRKRNWRAAKQELVLRTNLQFPCQLKQTAPLEESLWRAEKRAALWPNSSTPWLRHPHTDRGICPCMAP